MVEAAPRGEDIAAARQCSYWTLQTSDDEVVFSTGTAATMATPTPSMTSLLTANVWARP